MTSYDLINNSFCLVVNDCRIEKWVLDDDDLRDYEIALEFEYRDDVGHIFQYLFTAGALRVAKIEGNCIQLVDTEGDEVEIGCYQLKPLTLVK